MDIKEIKIGLIGDIHANLEAFTAVIAKMQELGITHYVCLGDVIGYNANPKECMDLLKGLKPIAVVQGNHDEYVGNTHELLGFNPQAAAAVNWTRNQLTLEERRWLATLPLMATVRLPGTGMLPFRIVHGTLDSPERWGYVFTRSQAEASMEYQKPEKVCFCGHSHIPMYFIEEEGNITQNEFTEEEPIVLKPNVKYMINIGSVGQPRDENPKAAFSVYAPGEGTVRLYRLEYDIATCQQKIREAKLPERLAQRLAVGK